MANLPRGYEQLLTPGEVARIFGVDPKTVNRWGKTGRLTLRRTPGGHGRYLDSEVKALLAGQGPSEFSSLTDD